MTGKFLALTLLLLPLAGCGSSTPTHTGQGNAEGTWSGQRGVTVVMELTQSGHEVSGRGSIDGKLMGVSGSVDGGHLALTLRSQQYSEVHLTGSFTTSGVIEAELNDSGFAQWAITLRRQ